MNDYRTWLYILIPAIIAGAIILTILSASGRKAISSQTREVSKATGKIGKDVFKRIDSWNKNRKNKKSNSNSSQLPGGIGQTNNPTPVFTPNKQPQKEVIIPLDFDNAPLGEIIYTKSCGDWTLDSEYNGNSVAFCVVGGWDDKKQRYKLWLYDPFEHYDPNKKQKSNYRVEENNYWERTR